MRKNDRPIHEVLKQFVNRSEKINQGIATVRIEELFRQEMGPVVSRYTESVKLRKDTLLIKVSSAPLRMELMHSRMKLMESLNAKLGQSIIQKIVVR